MSWQEELRRLDAQLAAGVITRDQHTRRRDEILAEASGDGSGEEATSTDTGSRDYSTTKDSSKDSSKDAGSGDKRPTGEVSADNGPRWEAANPAAAAQLSEGNDSSAPQSQSQSPSPSVSPSGHQSPSAPQSTPPQPAPPSTKPAATPLSYAPSTAPRQPAPLFVPQTPASAGRPGAAQTPTFAPSAPQQGFEQPNDQQSADYPDFSPPPKRGRKGTWLAVALAVLVALGAVIGGAWWLGQGGDSSADPAPSETVTNGPEGGLGGTDTDDSTLEERLPALPGTPSPDDSTMSVSRGLDLGFITSTDADSMRRFGVSDLIYRASADGTDGYSLVVARTTSPQKAGALGEALNTSLVKEGFSNDRLLDDPRFIAFTGEQEAGRVSIVWYSSGNATVGIGVSQPKNGNESELSERLEKTLLSLDDVLPAN